jgi:acetate kinase
VLVVNAGSSSVKLSLLDGEETLSACELSAPRAVVDERELGSALQDGLGDAEAVGHRIVHGGECFREAVVVDPAVETALRELVDIAPLHQPKSLAALDAVSRALPGVPAVACFDTSFHATLDSAAFTYAVPRGWRERWGLRRYGFHGLSHAWVARRVPELLGALGRNYRIVSCHLGAGASLCAIAGGRSVDTTMGFTPLEGLVMATRSGTVDPGLLLWLLERGHLSERELANALEHDSGLLGLAGTADMREVLARTEDGDGRADLALAVYLHRLRAAIGAMAASLGGLDVLAFTGGVGENSAEIRRRAVAELSFLGLAIDQERNTGARLDSDISASNATARTLVVRAREDLEIARQVRGALGSNADRQNSER